MNENILHINIPFFLASVESLLDSSLRNKPLIFANSTSLHSTIIDISETAYLSGIRKGMSILEAKRFEKNLTIIKPNPDRYSKALNSIKNIFASLTPHYELLASGEGYLNLKGTERLFGNTENIAFRLYKEIMQDLRLKSQIGLGSNKLISKVASSFFNNKALIRVINGEEKVFISPMSIKILPDIDGWIIKRLYDYSIFKVGDINRLKVEHLNTLFGKFGELLHLWGNGIDPRPIITDDAPFIKEEIDISYEENEERLLKHKIFSLASQIGFKLRERRLISGRFKLIITYIDDLISDGYTGLKTKTNTDISIYHHLLNLFYRIRSRRVNIKRISVISSLFSPLFIQQEILPLSHSRERRLFEAIDTIRNRFGKEAIQFGLEKDV